MTAAFSVMVALKVAVCPALTIVERGAIIIGLLPVQKYPA